MLPRVPKVHCTFQIIELLHLLRDSSPSQPASPGLFEDLAAIPELQPVDDLAISNLTVRSVRSNFVATSLYLKLCT